MTTISLIGGGLCGWLGFVLVFGGLGWWIAKQKGRAPIEGIVLGGVFGPIGCIVEALLPRGS